MQSNNCMILSDAPAIMSVFAQVHPNVVCDPKALQISHSLKVHRSKIASVINFVELEVYLNDKGFLDDGEGDRVITDLSQEGVELVLARVKERGDEGFKDFLWCLEQDSDWHIGHVYAIALLRGDTFTDETQRKIECSMKLRQKYRKQLDVMRIVENSLNTYDLIPSLRAHQLLTDDETEELSLPKYGRRERITKLLQILDTKGPLSDLYFTHALANAVRENPAHCDILERDYCQNFDGIIMEECENVERDSASTSTILGKRRRSLITKPYATKMPISNPRQVEAHGIILSEEYFNRINDIRRLHYRGDWDDAEKVVEECRLFKLTSTEKQRYFRNDEVSPTVHIELYVAMALRNCSGYITRKMTEKVLSIVSEAKELCRRIDNDNGRVLESKCQWMLAKLYRYSKEYDKAMEHIENAQLIHLRYNIAPGEDTTLCNYCKGCILGSQLAMTKQWSSKKFNEAKQCLRKAIEHTAIQDYAIYQSHHMIRLAQLCLHSSQFEAGTSEDIDQITEAEAALNSHYIDEKILAPRTKCLFYVTRSDLYRNKGDLKLAEEEAQRAYDIAVKNEFKTDKKSAKVRLEALKQMCTIPIAPIHGY